LLQFLGHEAKSTHKTQSNPPNEFLCLYVHHGLQLLDRCMFTFGVILLLLNLFASALQSGHFNVSAATVVSINIFVDFAAIVITSINFLFHGTTFIKRLNSGVRLTIRDREISDVRQRQLRKAVFWIVVSGAMQWIIIIGGGSAARSNEQFLTPSGFFFSFTFIYFGVTGTSLAQVISFRPLDNGMAKKTHARLESIKHIFDGSKSRPSVPQNETEMGASKRKDILEDDEPMSIQTGTTSKSGISPEMTRRMDHNLPVVLERPLEAVRRQSKPIVIFPIATIFHTTQSAPASLELQKSNLDLSANVT
jgi:hypothetical protein